MPNQFYRIPRVGLAALAVCGALVGAIVAAEPSMTTVYEHGVDGAHTYRIPAAIVTARGALLAFCEARRDNSRDHGNLDLVVRRSPDGGHTWGAIELVYEEGGDEKVTIGNPCPVVDRSNGRLWLPFTRDNDDVFLTYSDDDGGTWSEPRDITSTVKGSDWGWYATGPGVGIQLSIGEHAGRLVIPCDHRTVPEDVKGAHVIYSDDHGETWRYSQSIEPGYNECQVVELADGTLLLNARMQDSRETGERGVATSRDGGETWTDLSQASGLTDPLCQASLIALRERDSTTGQPLVLFSNPNVPRTMEKGPRENLTVRLSRDGGRTWPVSRPLHRGKSAYSSLVELSDGSIGCLYEGTTPDGRSGIHFARFPLDWLTRTSE